MLQRACILIVAAFVYHSADLPCSAFSRSNSSKGAPYLPVGVVRHAMITPVHNQKTLAILNDTAIPHDRQRDPAYLVPHCWRLQDCYSCLHSQYHCSWCAIVRALNTPPHGNVSLTSLVFHLRAQPSHLASPHAHLQARHLLAE